MPGRGWSRRSWVRTPSSCTPCCAPRSETIGLDYFASPLPINARSYIHIFGVLFFDVADEADARRSYEACQRMVMAAAKAGFGEYRTT